MQGCRLHWPTTTTTKATVVENGPCSTQKAGPCPQSFITPFLRFVGSPWPEPQSSPPTMPPSSGIGNSAHKPCQRNRPLSRSRQQSIVRGPSLSTRRSFSHSSGDKHTATPTPLQTTSHRLRPLTPTRLPPPQPHYTAIVNFLIAYGRRTPS